MADAWEGDTKTSRETERILAERRWAAIRSLWELKYPWYGEEVKQIMWEEYKHSEAGIHQFRLMKDISRAKGTMVEERVQAAWAFSKGTVKEAKEWIEKWRMREDDCWLAFVGDIKTRCLRAYVERSEGEWSSQNTMDWGIQLQKDHDTRIEDLAMVHATEEAERKNIPKTQGKTGDTAPALGQQREERAAEVVDGCGHWDGEMNSGNNLKMKGTFWEEENNKDGNGTLTSRLGHIQTTHVIF
eukprot:g46337.t1